MRYVVTGGQAETHNVEIYILIDHMITIQQNF